MEKAGIPGRVRLAQLEALADLKMAHKLSWR